MMNIKAGLFAVAAAGRARIGPHHDQGLHVRDSRVGGSGGKDHGQEPGRPEPHGHLRHKGRL